jgi:hypothetical protein
VKLLVFGRKPLPDGGPSYINSFHSLLVTFSLSMLETLITDCLESGRAVRFRASGRSMHPTIRQNEVVVVAPIEPVCLALGDIVLSRCGEKMTAHRLVQIDVEDLSDVIDEQAQGRAMMVLRGDACNVCDPPIPESQIVGKVVAVERQGRMVNPYGLRTEWVRRIYVLGGRLKSFLRSVF